MKKLLFLMLFFIVSCKNEKNNSFINGKIKSETISGVWNLYKVDDSIFELKKVFKYEVDNPTLKIEIEKKIISGSSGCNGFSAKAVITEKSIKLIDSGIMATEMGCGDGNKWEGDYFGRIMDIQSFKIKNDTLEIYNSNNKSMSFIRRHMHPIELNSWELTKVNNVLFDIKVAYGNENESQPVLFFNLEKNTIGGFDGCNSFGMKINFKGKNYTSGIVESNARGCYEGWSEKFYSVVGNNKSFSIKNDTLTLTNYNGDTLTFKKVE